MQNILFRSDSSSTIGTGHIMRDLVLAEQFEDANIIFATQNLDGNINHKIEEKNYEIEILNSRDIQELDILIKKLAIDMIIIDHYKIDYSFEKQLKIKNPTLKIMVLDDTYEKHYCDILLNHNISADSLRYKNLVPEHCELRCGSAYTLLREEFIEEKKKQVEKNIEKSIFLSMGGSDAFGYNLKILNILKKFPDIKATVVTTTANQNINELQKFALQNKWVKLHINSKQIAHLMNKCHFAIITPSVTVNEALYLEIPFISLKVIDNQADIHNYLVKNNYRAVEDLHELEKHIQELINE